MSNLFAYFLTIVEEIYHQLFCKLSFLSFSNPSPNKVTDAGSGTRLMGMRPNSVDVVE